MENVIRLIAVGRKNWLLCDTQAAVRAGTVIFIIPETAAANGRNPENYLNHLQTVLPERFARSSATPVESLLPLIPEMRRQFGA